MSAPVAAPVTKKAAVVAAKPKKVATHPTYFAMIADALKKLAEKSGSSRQALVKYIVANNKIDEKTCNQHVKVALRNGVKSGKLKQSKGVGASGSFRLGAIVKKGPSAEQKAKKAAAKAATKAKLAAKKAAQKEKIAAKKAALKAKQAAKKVTKKVAKKPVLPRKPLLPRRPPSRRLLLPSQRLLSQRLSSQRPLSQPLPSQRSLPSQRLPSQRSLPSQRLPSQRL